jgi:ABC-type lipoprotein release transport system permease subunit
MQYFVPFSQVPVPPFIPNPERGAWGLLLRVDTDVAAVAPAVRRIVVGSRTDVPFIRIRPYAQLLDRQMRPWRLGTALLGLFSALALCVGAVGLYAAFSHAVTVRRREMAIRIAIGAKPAGVTAMILREALRLAGAGILAGWIAAMIGGRWLQSLLFDTSRTDPMVLGAAAAVMLAVAVIATLLPARAASRANPAALLRT